jgi:hypothetical protein
MIQSPKELRIRNLGFQPKKNFHIPPIFIPFGLQKKKLVLSLQPHSQRQNGW